MNGRTQLLEALDMLGQILQDRGLRLEIVVVGGAALMLSGVLDRPTLDLDAVAQISGGNWRKAMPLPPEILEAVKDVARALALPEASSSGKDWLNGNSEFLLAQGLPRGFDTRVTKMFFGPLVVNIPARQDLIALKLLAATAAARGGRRQVDIEDLRALAPSQNELREAVRWCQAKDGRSDFFEQDAAPVLRALGLDPEAIRCG